MKKSDKMTMNEFFNWQRHPFTDTHTIKEPYLCPKDLRIRDRAISLLQCGKSFAITGPSGAGKSTLLQHILASLDGTRFTSVLLHYGGLQRSGILRAIADLLGVESGGRAIPLLVKLQKHISHMAAENNAPYPVFVIDDAQLMERESLMDLCSLLVNPATKTAAASLVLAGDENLARNLNLHIMESIRTRLTCIFGIDPLNVDESQAFIASRLETAGAPDNLLERDAMEIVASHCRGNRRQIMNVGTLLLDEAFYRKEKTIGSQLVLSCDLMDIST